VRCCGHTGWRTDEAVEHSQFGLNHMRDHRTQAEGYRCEASFVVRFGNLDGVQPLLLDLLGAGVDGIDGLDYDVADEAELRADARRQAVAAGRARAELYAEAAGVRLGVVLHIEDLPPDRFDLDRLSLESSPSPSSVPMPGQVAVSAAVMLGFAIDHE
jgi:uncharacterized protein